MPVSRSVGKSELVSPRRIAPVTFCPGGAYGRRAENIGVDGRSSFRPPTTEQRQHASRAKRRSYSGTCFGL